MNKVVANNIQKISLEDIPSANGKVGYDDLLDVEDNKFELGPNKQNLIKFNIDYHDLNTFYKLEPISDDGKLFKVFLSVDLVLLKGESGKTAISVQVDGEYPKTCPLIICHFEPVGSLKTFTKQSADQTLIDVEKLYKWDEKSSTLLDLINEVNVLIESRCFNPVTSESTSPLQIAHNINYVRNNLEDLNKKEESDGKSKEETKCVKKVIIVRDFAYPVSSPLHWGRFQLRPDVLPRQVKAIYDFDAQDENELAFKVGDVIDVVYERDDGWLVGMMNGISGLVPINHIEKV